jgi:hypothetical protein
MSEIQEIDVYISPAGEVKIEVRGVKGKKCMELTSGLEAVLGGNVILREHTNEFQQNEQELEQSANQGLYS